MSNIGLIIEERASNIGNFVVGRLLPFRQKRMVGPFIFIDHMGPAQLKKGEGLNVGPHPHIGLSTLTYLLEGNVLHKDSLGTEIEIKPGAVNLMKAGKGIVHSERTPERLRNQDKILHGLQIWLALPIEEEMDEPQFTHINDEDLPKWSENGADFKLILGEYNAKKSPVPMSSPSYLIEITAEKDVDINIGNGLFGESGLYIISGAVEVEGNRFDEHQMLIANEATLCAFRIKKGSKVFVFGGEPFEEERFIYWNFVSSSKDRLEKAKEDWAAQRFPKIEGETDFVPLPQSKI